jgi:hypothetical protein
MMAYDIRVNPPGDKFLQPIGGLLNPINAMGGINAALAQNQALAARRGFFRRGGPGRAILGNIGDYLSQLGGGQPVYAPAVERQMLLDAEARKRAYDLDDYNRARDDALADYSRSHADQIDLYERSLADQRSDYDRNLRDQRETWNLQNPYFRR